MQIVISIEDEFYDFIKEQVKDGITNPLKVAIVNGKILPKGHGRIGDLDRLYTVFEKNVVSAGAFKELFDHAPTIIEADRGSEDKE